LTNKLQIKSLEEHFLRLTLCELHLRCTNYVQLHVKDRLCVCGSIFQSQQQFADVLIIVSALRHSHGLNFKSFKLQGKRVHG
jgi:hypothetical protein